MSKAQWRSDLSDSRRQFINLVWPEIHGWFTESDADAVDLIPAEGSEDALRESFDTTAGIDFWIVDGENRMVSLASRVQAQYDLTTFTVRYSRRSGVDTEHQKRVRQCRDDHACLPTWTVQAYVDTTLQALQNAAAVPTAEMYEYILSRRCPITDDELIGSDEAEKFYAVEWSNLDDVASLRVYNRSRASLLDRSGQPGLSKWAGGGSE